MILPAGSRLGPYEILDLLGVGGMGEVYRARDPRLGREVAIKVLSRDLTSDPDRLARFEREARAVAALNHPNILTVHDVGTDAATPYVVTELLAGETLRELLRRRPPGERQSLLLMLQAARGLEAAHGKGIVHRDLKPENVFVTTDGRVKVLDFGLAKLVAAESAASVEETESSPTKDGMLVGTVGYMSPEQVRGLPVDARSDVFSFGVVLYELLSGKHPFRRETTVGTLSAVLEGEPAELSSVARGVSPAVVGIVRRCLEKEREGRYPSGHELAVALEVVAAAPAGSAVLQEAEEKSPYPGLMSFTERDAAQFFGRETEVGSLWERLRSRHLSGVIGPSGAGKTSFVRAGVVASRPPGWGTLVCTPGATPFRGLAHALASELAGDAESVRELLRFDDPAVAFDLVSRWRRGYGEALLVVDQFEELFTLNPAEVQERFAGLLGRLAREGDVHVLLSLRDDFLMKCADHEPIGKVFESLSPLSALSREGLRRAVEDPAKARGYRFEDDALVAEMVESVEGARAALPLLAFAVLRLWEKRDREKKLLTRAAYEEIGGVAGALAQHAEATLDRIGSERQIVRELFRNLVTSQGTRAVVDREELLSAFPERQAAEEVLRELIDARLLTSYELEGKEGEPSHHRIEVVHESLLKAWPRLVRWQMQDEEGAVLRDQLKQAAHLWQEKSRSPDLLWSGTAYQEYELWRVRYAGALTALEEDFAQAMRERARRRRRVMTAGIAAAFLVLLAVAGAIAVSRQQAVAARSRAEASKLLALGQVEIDRYPTAALAYTTKSLEINDTPEGRLQALRILWKAPPARILPMPDGTASLNLAFSRDGRWLAATGFDPVVALFSEDGRLAHRLTREGAKARAAVPFLDFGGDAVFWWTWGGPEVLAWTLDGHTFPAFGGPQWWVTGSEEGALTRTPPPPGVPGALLQQWSVSRGVARFRRRLPVAADEFPDPAFVRLFRNAGPSLYVRPFPREGSDVPPVLVGRHEADIGDMDAPPGGERVLSIDRSGEWRLWSTADRRLLARRKPPPPHAYSAALFDRTGSRIGWTSAEGPATYVWDLGDPPDAELLRLRWGDTSGDGGRVAFHPGGHWMAAAAGYRSVSFWPLGSPHARVLQGHTQGPIGNLRFTADSRHLVSCARDGLRVWPLGLGEGVQQRVELPSNYLCYGADVDPRGETLALAAESRGLFVVPLATRKPRRVLPVEPGLFFGGSAFDVAGRRLATGQIHMEDPADGVIRVVDLDSGAARTYSIRSRRAPPWPVSSSFGFTWDGRLLSGGEDGIFRWDPESGRPTSIYEAPGKDVSIRTTPDGRWLTAAVGDPPANNTEGMRNPRLLIFDLTKGTHWPVTSHGSEIGAATLDAGGTRLVTSDATGTVRVGSASGGVPHILVGHSSRVDAVAVSPDGKWIASASGTEIRLWPMPDVSKPPFHTLPHDELMARLRALTNLQAVEDKAAATGYKLDVGPFSGWKDVPTW